MPKNKEMLEELANIRRKEEEDVTNAFKQKIYSERQAHRKDELEKNKIFGKDQQGNPITYWEQAMKLADDAINKELSSYNDGRGAMSSLLNMYYILCQAIAGSMASDGTFIDSLFLPSPEGSSELELPSLSHNVSFTDDNKLKIEPLFRSDNKDNKGEIEAGKAKLDTLFEKLVVQWLKDSGYTPDPTDNTVFQKAGVVLDKATFDELKNDPDDGLNHYLQERSDLTFTPSYTPSGP